MNTYIDTETIKLFIDRILYETSTPITIKAVLRELLSIQDGKNKIIRIVGDGYLESSTIELLKPVISIYEQIYTDMMETIKELVTEEESESEIQDLIDEAGRVRELVLILRSITNDNITYVPPKEPDEDYIFITLEDPNRKGHSIMERDIDEEDSETVLEYLERMEELAKSQLSNRGKFEIRKKGNGMHNHGQEHVHVVYKHCGTNPIRIQIKRLGKEGNIIAVLAITPPSDVHRNTNGENTRTDMYDSREELLEIFLETCPKDEDGTYILEDKTIERLQSLYKGFKERLEVITSSKESENIDALETLAERIRYNYELAKVAL